GNWLAAHLPVDIGFTWVLVGAPIAPVGGLLLLRLVLSLPRRALIGILLAGALFVLGAIGVETLNGRHLAARGWIVDNRCSSGWMLEEVVEMSGISSALAALISLFRGAADGGSYRRDPSVQGEAPVRTVPSPGA